MRWDDRLGEVFEDLEQQAEGLALAQRDAEVAELVRAEYAQVDLVTRLHGSLGRRLQVAVPGVGVVDGVLSRAGADWFLVDAGSCEWLVRPAATGHLRGLAQRAVPVVSRPVTARLGLGSALRSLAQERADVVLHRVDGSATRGVMVRVGADFVDLRSGEGPAGYVETVPFGALAAVRTG
jgi:hypothetical protein